MPSKHTSRFRQFIDWRRGKYPVTPSSIPPVDFTYPNTFDAIDSSAPLCCWINHSTYLIITDRATYLTDPIFSKRCSPVQFLGPKRQHTPGLPLDALPPIDRVLLSHDHYDHLDKNSAKALSHVPWTVPKGVGDLLTKWGVTDVTEVDRWATSGTVTAIPTRHFTGRKLWGRDATPSLGYVIKEGSKSVYFVGDTGFDQQLFEQVFKRFGSPDLSLIPIGAYEPRGFMGPVHINPDEASALHEIVQSKLSIGGHFGTFVLSSEGIDQPPYDLYQALLTRKIDPSTFRVLQPGQAINW